MENQERVIPEAKKKMNETYRTNAKYIVAMTDTANRVTVCGLQKKSKEISSTGRSLTDINGSSGRRPIPLGWSVLDTFVSL